MTTPFQPLDTSSPSENIPLDPSSGSNLRQRASLPDNPEADVPNQQNSSNPEDHDLIKGFFRIRNEIDDSLGSWFLVVVGLVSFSLLADLRLELYIAVATTPLVFLVKIYFLKSLQKHTFRTLATVAMILKTNAILPLVLFITVVIRSWGIFKGTFSQICLVVIILAVLGMIFGEYREILRLRELRKKGIVLTEKP